MRGRRITGARNDKRDYQTLQEAIQVLQEEVRRIEYQRLRAGLPHLLWSEDTADNA